MWKKIKSTLILKRTFYNVDNKTKINIIIYNKEIQKKLGLDLIDFRRFSGRYIIGNYDYIREYNSLNDKLIFEGQYKNNKRNGKGKEYNENGKLIFDGEYLDGKKWKGKYYKYDNVRGNLILECEYLNGIIDGEAKEYDKYNKNLLFSGKYKNGKRNGQGIEYKTILIEKSEDKYGSFLQKK